MDTDSGRAALEVFRRTMTIVEMVRDVEFVFARLQGNMYVFSCYVFLQYPLVHFLLFLQCLEDYIRSLEANAKIIIADDFNVRSTA